MFSQSVVDTKLNAAISGLSKSARYVQLQVEKITRVHDIIGGAMLLPSYISIVDAEEH